MWVWPAAVSRTVRWRAGAITVPGGFSGAFQVEIDAQEVVASGPLPTLNVSSGTGAWTFGQPIQKGAAVWLQGPSGTQVEIRNRWNDGSAKFAVISGVNVASAPLTAVAANPYASGEVAWAGSASVTFSGSTFNGT